MSGTRKTEQDSLTWLVGLYKMIFSPFKFFKFDKINAIRKLIILNVCLKVSKYYIKFSKFLEKCVILKHVVGTYIIFSSMVKLV